ERVRRDQPLVEVTTDKVDAEIPAPEDGVVEKILVAEGETVPVGAALLMLAVGSETAASPASSVPRQLERPEHATPVASGATPAPGVSPQAAEGGAQRGAAERSSSGLATAQQPRPTPVARRLAEAEGIDLGAAAATGPGGRVSKADV